MTYLHYGHQQITDEDIEEVVKALKSDWLTQGPCVTAFENAVCEKVGSDYGVSCTNGTSALHLAIVAAGVKKGDYVIAPAMTFAASANCARFEGAEVLFADIDNKTTVTMSVDSCRALLEKARKEDKPVKAVVTVDMTGHLCNMEAFAKLKKEFGFVWIQDACHSIGGSWTSSDGKTYRVGEYKEVDMTAFSFHPVKHITTGEGGMVVTHNEEYAKTMRLYRTHGIVRDEAAFINKDEAYDADGNLNPWYSEMQTLGYNYRLTDFQAALGISQLKRLDYSIQRRRQIADLYRKEMQDCKLVEFPYVEKNVGHAYHLVVALIDFEKAGKSRAMVMKYLRDHEIGTQVHYLPLPMMPYYAKTCDAATVPNAVAYYRKALSLPCYPQLTDDDVKRVCSALKKALE